MEAPVGKLSVFTNVENRATHVAKWFHSGMYFAITFIFLHYFGYLISFANAHYLGFEPSVSFDGLSSLRHTTGWGPRSIAFVYLAPAAFGFFVFALSVFSFFRVSRTKTHFRNFLFWLALNGYLLFYSFFLFGLIGVEHRHTDFYGSYAAVFDWLYWSDKSSYAVITILAVVFLLAGLLFAPLILAFNHSQSITLKKRFHKVIFSNVVLVPMLIGLLVVGAACFPLDAQLLGARIVSAIPLLLVSFLSMKLIPDGKVVIVRGGLSDVPILRSLLLAVLLVIVTRLILTIQISI